MAQLDVIERSIEAVLFASGEPVESERLAQAMEIDDKTVRNLVERIRDRYLSQRSPFDIIILEDSYQMCSLAEYAGIIRKTLEIRKNAALSQAALEVLAVVAYNQPVTRAFIEQVRGVDCSSIVRSLVEKDLIEEAGRMNIPGKPIVYKTTANFLRCFGMDSIEQLPTLPDLPPEGDAGEEQVDGQIDFFE